MASTTEPITPPNDFDPNRRLRVGLVSSDFRRHAVGYNLLPWFDHVQGTDGFPCKPAPDVLLRSISALGARPEDCLFVGDSEADMEAGRRAGVRICAVDYGYGKSEALAKWEPDYWVSDLRELLVVRV